jgi:negative regulator of flagellin synthesis FlgM
MPIIGIGRDMSMMIDRIGSIDPIQNGKKPGRTNQVNKPDQADSISLSSEAVERSEHLRAANLIAAAPDVRSERVEELKKKINDPSYLDEKMIVSTADKLIEALWNL